MTRVVVCGTAFGQVYLEGLAAAPPPLELAGVVGRGSARSRACAARHGVPLLTSVDAVPDDVDAACVVVGGGLLGGPGTELADALLTRGVAVLQEHPLHRDELAGLVRTARRHGTAYRLNTFYPHLPVVRSFLAATRALAARHPVRYVEGACGFPVGYATFDLLARAAGALRPWRFEVGPACGRGVGFRTVQGTLGDVGFVLRLEHRLDPAAPDGYLHLLQRLTVGTDAGELTLVSTHGPVVWVPRPGIPVTVHDDGDETGYAAATGPDRPAYTVLGPASGPPERRVYRDDWPAGVRHAVGELLADRAGSARSAQHHLALCELWQEISARLGPPVTATAADVAGLAAAVLDDAGLAELVAAGGHRG